MAEKSMRDAFFEGLYDAAKADSKIILVSADMSAPSLDKFRSELPAQYVNVGIAEASAMTFAAGLAKEGRKPYTYAIMPFITSRVHEFVKLEMGLMELPITVVGVGTGYSYEDSGPTHHTVEDISIMRAVPNLQIYSPSDAAMARNIVPIIDKSSRPTYVRLDRVPQNSKYSQNASFEKGFSSIKGEDICIVATGNTVDMAMEAMSRLGEQGRGDIGVIDLYRLKPINPAIVDELANYPNIVTIEEHLLAGGLGSIVSELITDNGLSAKLKRVGVDDKYNYEYGGRDYIQQKMGVGIDNLLAAIDSARGD